MVQSPSSWGDVTGAWAAASPRAGIPGSGTVLAGQMQRAALPSGSLCPQPEGQREEPWTHVFLSSPFPSPAFSACAQSCPCYSHAGLFKQNVLEEQPHPGFLGMKVIHQRTSVEHNLCALPSVQTLKIMPGVI